MSCSLPPEILDLIVDHLRDRSAALKACCVVSKSWIPRTRKHLFAHVTFCKKSHIEQWKKTFPNPSNSPAHYTRSLSVRDFPVVTAAEVDVGGWIRPFHRVVNLDVDTRGSDESQVSLIPLHGPLPTLKSIALTYTSVPPSEIFGLVCSFPLLEDLELLSRGYESEVDGWKAPSVSPKFTGSLCLAMLGGIRSTIHRLLDLPGGVHFSKITVLCLNEDVEPTADLLLGCSDTLEFLTIYYVPGAFPPASLIDQYLTTTCGLRPIHAGFVRPLYGHKSQRIGISQHTARCAMDHHSTANRRIQKPSTNHHLPVYCLPEPDWGGNSAGMAAP